jgi:hypothetical protein
MMRGVSRFSVAAAVLLLSASGASAEEETIARRLTKHGELRRGEAESLSESVSKRMKRAADITSAQDPLRAAVARALGVTNPNDAMGAAKIRLRLYAGLNEWALENLFAPRPGGIGRCQQEFGISLRQCEALVAAAGRVPAKEASKLAGGAPPPMPAAQQQQMATNRPAQPATGSRFGKYDSGYHPGAAKSQPAPAARPIVAQRPMAPQPMAVAPNPNAKEEYARKRAEYLERKRVEMEARKAKLVAANSSSVDRGPAAEQAAAEAAAAEPAAPAQAKVAGPKGKAADAEEAPVEDAPAAEPAGEKKAALDGDLLDSLLGDPMGKK